MTNWTNNNGIYMVPMPATVDKQQIKCEMDTLEQRLQVAEAAMAARKGVSA
ncbi:pilus assembly protein PilO [Sporosarcina sp. P13]|uniref:pilus assembly protein PilO n=1 Tax=Sporosarcina sp. P13 TaxID=2048263 RepID=UPI000C16C217|nr:pilus assembly protein PilO [Sporosarcina sp. P13]PIC65364.1 pilus assembly protein PilO [Sporosarcina sp. P13]